MSLETMLQAFRILIPEFEEIPDEKVNFILAMNDNKVSSLLKENVREEAIVYLTAHMIDLGFKKAGSGGMVKSLTEGRLSIEYATSSQVNDDLDCSSYGRRFKSIVHSNLVSVIV